MFCRASLLSLVTLALFAAAAASPRLAKRATGVSIPLAKRSGLTTTDGVFDLEKAGQMTVLTQNKYCQNRINGANGTYNGASHHFAMCTCVSHTTHICSRALRENLGQQCLLV
jgi:hypothetical protein